MPWYLQAIPARTASLPWNPGRQSLHHGRLAVAARPQPLAHQHKTAPRHLLSSFAAMCRGMGTVHAAAGNSSTSEVEIKLRLADREAHDKVAEALKSSFKAKHHQENFFFDGSSKELSTNLSVLRCRFYNETERALLTLKGKQKLVGGIGRGTELETDIDPIKARKLLETPDDLLGMKVGFVDEVCSKLGVKHLVALGGFKNVRKDFSWEGFKLELDETQFEWGTVFEIEVETEEPEQLKVKLEAFLHEHRIPYSYSSVTKFHNFVNRTLD